MLQVLVVLNLLLSMAHAWNNDLKQYAPTKVDCEKQVLVRPATDISNAEKEWLNLRDEKTHESMIRFFETKTNLSKSEYLPLLSNNTARFGLAFSGGAVRAMLVGGGNLAALDNRTVGAFENGLGGLAQAATYFTGLSGSALLVGSVAINDWMPIQEVIDSGNKIWDFSDSIPFIGGKPTGVIGFINRALLAANYKRQAGFKVSLMDLMGNFFGYFMNPRGVDYYGETWSGITKKPSFVSGEMPLPIISTVYVPPSNYVEYSNSTTFEINPFEFGSWDQSARAFTDIKYLGTKVDNGRVTEEKCVNGFDNAMFMVATSAAMYNNPADKLIKGEGTFNKIVQKVLPHKNTQENFLSIFEPNPFYNSEHVDLNEIKDKENLLLGDGGIDAESLPLHPLIQQPRKVDSILAFDCVNETDTWPNGTSIYDVYKKQFTWYGSNYAFPPIPEPEIFVKKGFNKNPVFFGCDAKNLTDLKYIPPLVIYVPNKEYTFRSNISSAVFHYSTSMREKMLQNSFEVATLNNQTVDNQWGTCIGCAMLRRSQERANIEQSEECAKCFSKYCWDGSL